MTEQFIEELQAVIKRHEMENDLSYAEVIGALELIKDDIIQEIRME